MAGCRPLTRQEIGQALGALGGSRIRQRNRCLFILGLYSGFRISELLSLRVGDVIQDGRVLPRVRVERRAMKGKRQGREVVLNERARQALAEWLPVLFRWRGAQSDTYLFQSQQSGSITRRQAARIMHDLAQRFGWPPQIGTHTLRKTFAQGLYESASACWRPGQEIPVRVVQKALGHRGVDTTERYLGVDVAAVDKHVLALNITGG